ncbi:hypothetical protein FJU08_10495 [Martelella alba]|uniref:Phage integrase family protein n=1 Tax=Martelella alba TaxID=2590451 RepID=A0A506U9L6_9HYPH|nr:hypothetical protein [Martelella alba]TPW31073.1 hypothetical protein FJU08_10495 [Martelella alba]
MGRLTANEVKAVLGKRGTYGDGDGLLKVPAVKRELVVPLSPDALAVLRSTAAVRLTTTDHVFPGSDCRVMSDIALLGGGRMKKPVTGHGFRSSFRTWVAEATNCPGEVVEATLVHQNPNEVERAHQRGGLLDKRRSLMQAWGAYCANDTTLTKLVPIRKTGMV